MIAIKKIGAFIASRALYFMLGLLIAVGATYVYATWDQARTGDSGELSEPNWNELVTMIENNIGGGDFLNCETRAGCDSTVSETKTLTCSAGKSIRTATCVGSTGGDYSTHTLCYITSPTTLYIDGYDSRRRACGSIMCCDD